MQTLSIKQKTISNKSTIQNKNIKSSNQSNYKSSSNFKAKSIIQNVIKFTKQEQINSFENGKLIQQFLTYKMSILDKILQFNKTNIIIQICQKKQFNDKINRIKQSTNFINNYINEKKIIFTNQEIIQLNEQIYKFLVHICQFLKNYNQEFNQLFGCKNTQITQRQSNNLSKYRNEYLSPYMNIKNNKTTSRDASTNHVTKNKSINQNKSKPRKFTEQIKSWEQYELYNDVSSPKRGSEYGQSQMDSLDQNQADIVMNSEEQYEDYILEQKSMISNKLQSYFLSWIISYSATNTNYKAFLIDLLKNITINRQQFNEQAQRIIQQKLQSDSQYSMQILQLVLKRKYVQSLINDQQKLQTQYFSFLSNDLIFLKMVVQFIKVNMDQLLGKAIQFQTKSNKINQIYTQIDLLNIQPRQKWAQNNLMDSLSLYLPQQFKQGMILNEFTFSPKALTQIRKKIKQSQIFYQNKHTLYASLNIFEKIITKICFNRILNCKRFNLLALNRIFYCIKCSHVIFNHLSFSFNSFKQYMILIQQRRKFEDKKIAQINQKRLRIYFKAWKIIKKQKIKLLKLILKKKIKVQQKQQNLIFNRWRINISRQRIQQKLLSHSYSCNTLLNKFASKQIQNIELKKNKSKKKQKTENYEQKYAQQPNFSSIISLNKQSSLKNMSYLNKQSVFSRTKINQKMKYQSKDINLKLFNEKYKFQIQNRLKKQNVKTNTKKLVFNKI